MSFRKWHYLILITVGLWLINSQTTGMSYNTPRNKLIIDTTKVANQVFLRVVTSKPAVYKGEPFVVKYMLYNAVSVIDPGTNNDLKFTNCYQEEFPEDPKQSSQTIQGVVYNVVALKQYLVIPSNVGKMVLPRLKIQLKMYGEVQNDFFGTQKLITTELRSNTASIIVNDLPRDPDTTAFSGGIGQFKITGAYAPHKKTKNMLVFHLVIDGNGNTKATSVNLPELPQGLETFNTNTTRNDVLVEGGIKTHLEYSFQLVANYRGEYDVPSVNIKVFDPAKGSYITYSSPTYAWTVDQGPPKLTPAKISPISEPNNLYISNKLEAKNSQIYSSSGLFVILLLLGGLLLIYTYQPAYFNRLTKNYWGIVSAKRNRYLTLKSIEKLITISSELDEDAFCRRLISILYKFIQKEIGAANAEISNLSFEHSLLSQHLLPENISRQVVPFLTDLNIIRFSAVHVNKIDKLQSCNQLITIVKTVDGNLHE